MKKILALLFVLIMVISLFACGESDSEVTKGSSDEEITVSVKIVHADKSEKEITVKTKKDSLEDVLLKDGIIKGTKGEFGLYIDEVDGEVADYSVDEGWWSITVNGKKTDTGISGIDLSEGDSVEFTYTRGF